MRIFVPIARFGRAMGFFIRNENTECNFARRQVVFSQNYRLSQTRGKSAIRNPQFKCP